MTVKPGDRVVARDLPVNRGSKANRLPPAVALVVQVDHARVLIRLRIGSFGMARPRFAPRPRECLLENLARLATRREVVVGAVLDPLP